MDNLIRKITITRDARFEAYRRMKRRKLSSTVSLAMLSLCIICFNIIQLLPDFKIYGDAITAVTIMLSALVLTMSLLVTGLSYSEKEHQYKECAMRLSKLIDNADLEKDSTPDSNALSKLKYSTLNSYHSILAECPVNHIKIDYKRAMSRDDKRKIDDLKKIQIWMEWNILDVNLLYWILAIAIPFIAWYAIKLLQTY